MRLVQLPDPLVVPLEVGGLRNPEDNQRVSVYAPAAPPIQENGGPLNSFSLNAPSSGTQIFAVNLSPLFSREPKGRRTAKSAYGTTSCSTLYRIAANWSALASSSGAAGTPEFKSLNVAASSRPRRRRCP